MEENQSSHSAPLEVGDFEDNLVIKLPFQDISNHPSGVNVALEALSLFREQHMRARYRNGDARFFLEEFDELPTKDDLEEGEIRIPSYVDECFRPSEYGVKTFSGWQPRQKRAHCFQILNSYVKHERRDNKLPDRWMSAVRTLYPGST
jgi:hypothetical protein